MRETITEETIEGEVVDFPTIEVPEEAEYHTILEVWKAVLAPARDEREAKITPSWGSRICQAYGQVTFSDLPAVQVAYFDKVIQLLEILEQEIEGDSKCLKPTEAAEDAEKNGHHYKNLILNWQLAILQWELDWDCTDVRAAAELAAISEVHRMFFGELGIVGFLDQTPFEFTAADQEMLGEALEEFRAGNSE